MGCKYCSSEAFVWEKLLPLPQLNTSLEVSKGQQKFFCTFYMQNMLNYAKLGNLKKNAKRPYYAVLANFWQLLVFSSTLGNF